MTGVSATNHANDGPPLPTPETSDEAGMERPHQEETLYSLLRSKLVGHPEICSSWDDIHSNMIIDFRVHAERVCVCTKQPGSSYAYSCISGSRPQPLPPKGRGVAGDEEILATDCRSRLEQRGS